MTLAGRRIVVTRATHQADDLVALIEAHGWIAVSYPCIAIAQPEDTSHLDAAIRNLHSFDWVIFTSSNTVYAVNERLQELNLTFDWRKIQITSVGNKTDEVVQSICGRSSDFVPSHYKATDLASEIPIQNGECIFLPLSARSDGELTDLLIARGTDVTTVDAYENVIGTGGKDVPTLLAQNKIDALTFTSGSTVENFVKRIAPLTAYDIPAICIGPSTHEVAVKLGFTNAHYPENYSLEDMIHLLEQLFEEVAHGNT